MAGYHGYSKSNNALIAEEELKFPASVAARKLGVSIGAIKTILSPCEWHHTSGYFNRTDYYFIGALLALKSGRDVSSFDEEEEEIRATWEKLQAFKPVKATEKKYRANVRYLEWGGTRRRPKATERVFDDIIVVEKGQFYTFLTPSGGVRKKVGSNGTQVEEVES